jgi:hypothetical protein
MAKITHNPNKGRPETPTEWTKQNNAKQHLQERQELQKKSRRRESDAESLTPRFWNPETKQYDILAVWDKQKRQWVKPNE